MLEILIVDDVREDVLLAERVIRTQCKLVNPIALCISGEEALAKISELERAGTPYLMLLDVVMGPTSGFDVLRARSKQMKKVQTSAVVMMSGLTDLKAVHTGYQLGADTFVFKPFTREDMMQVLDGFHGRISADRVETGYALRWLGGGNEDPSMIHKTSRILSVY